MCKGRCVGAVCVRGSKERRRRQKREERREKEKNRE